MKEKRQRERVCIWGGGQRDSGSGQREIVGVGRERERVEVGGGRESGGRAERESV